VYAVNRQGDTGKKAYGAGEKSEKKGRTRSKKNRKAGKEKDTPEKRRKNFSAADKAEKR